MEAGKVSSGNNGESRPDTKGKERAEVNEHVRRTRHTAADDVMISYSHRDTAMMEKVLSK